MLQAELHLYGLDGENDEDAADERPITIPPFGRTLTIAQMQLINFHFPICCKKLQGQEDQRMYYCAVRDYLREIL